MANQEDGLLKYALAALSVGAVLSVGAATYGVKVAREHKYLSVEQFWSRTLLNNEDEIEAQLISGLGYDSFAVDSTRRNQTTETAPQEDERTPLDYDDLRGIGAEIRLLKILPSSRVSPGTVQCILDTVLLDEAPPYVALSYRWTSAKARDPVNINGRDVYIGQNLYDAIIEFREREDKLLWTDKLCINQANHQEKGEQIIKMTTIYHRADKVVAWIGQEDDEAIGLEETYTALAEYMAEPTFHDRELLHDLMRMWLDEHNISGYGFSNYRRICRKYPDLEALLSRSRLPKNDLALYARQQEFQRQLSSVLNREFWMRAWIVQELTVARNLEIWFGRGHDLDPGLLARTLSELFDLRCKGADVVMTGSHEHVQSLFALRHRWQTLGSVSLFEALFWTRRTVSTYAHDKVYALLGLTSDAMRFVASRTYDEDMSIPILRIAQNAAQSTKSLDFICLRTPAHSAFRQLLPSWAPDWATVGQDLLNLSLLDYIVKSQGSLRSSGEAEVYTASGVMEPRYPEVFRDERALGVRGHTLGRICKLTSSVRGYAKATEDTVSMRFCSKHQRPGSRLKASLFFELFTLNQKSLAAEFPFRNFDALWEPESMKSISEYSPTLYQWLLHHISYETCGRSLYEWSKGTTSSWDIPERMIRKVSRGVDVLKSPIDKLKRLIEAVATVLHSGQLLMEVDEGDVGWAHPLARCDDIVMLLEGCSFPVIIRESEDTFHGIPTYSVVGNAYVSGAMQGQLWPAVEKLQNIYLK